jgi:hypothetical protein
VSSLKLELAQHVGECWPVHHKETRLEAQDPLGGVDVRSTSCKKGSQEDPKMPASRMRLERRDLEAQVAGGMETKDPAPKGSEVLHPLCL